MTLKNGQTVTFAPAVREDAAELLEYLKAVGGESGNLLHGAEGIGMSLEEEEAFIQKAADAPNDILLVGRIDGEVACIGNIFAVKHERAAHNSELGLSIRKKFWNQGLGTLAMTELIKFARQCEGTEIVRLQVRADNEFAIRLYKKFGFAQNGFNSRLFKIDGEYYDDIHMELKL